MPIVNRLAITTVGDFQDGLDSFGSHQPVLNFAPVTTTGLVSNGILDLSAGAHVINRDAITVTGDGGVDIVAIGDHADITNFAPLANLGTTIDPDGIPFDGDETFAEGVVVFGDHFNVLNRGAVTLAGDFGAAFDLEGSNGRLVNDGSVSANGAFSAAFFILGQNDVAVNSASVQAEGVGGAGFELVGDNGSLTNSGSITAGGDFGVGMTAIGADETLTNAKDASISVTGFDAFGMYAPGDNETILNQGQVLAIGNQNFGLIAEGSGESVTNSGGVSLTGPNERGAYVVDHSQIANWGAISVSGVGSIAAWGNGAADVIENHGTLAADGLAVIGARIGSVAAPSLGSGLSNYGHIAANGDGSDGVSFVSLQSQILNHGLIEGSGGLGTFFGYTFRAGAVTLAGDQNVLTNASDGSIVAHGLVAVGVQLNNSGGTSATIDPTAHETLNNYGLIHSDASAILGGVASEAVFNFGRIEGEVNLGDGADRYEAESGGVLVGTLTLGGGADTLALHHNFGALTVADFTAGGVAHDVLDVSALGIKTLGAFLGSASQVGGDVVVNLGHGDVLTLTSVTLATLNAGDFIFGH
jgi:hypothetical protein